VELSDGTVAASVFRGRGQADQTAQAHHEATHDILLVICFRNLGIPAMYARIIPFPVDYKVRDRHDFQQMLDQAQMLDRELQRLARCSFRSSGEWAKQTATPMVRTECIRNYLLGVTAVEIATTAGERRRRRIINARSEFNSTLSTTAGALSRLSDPTVEPAGRLELLKQLSLYRARLRRILEDLSDLFEKSKRPERRYHRLRRYLMRRAGLLPMALESATTPQKLIIGPTEPDPAIAVRPEPADL